SGSFLFLDGAHAPCGYKSGTLCVLFRRRVPRGTFPRRASLVSGKNAGVPHIPRCRRPLADNRVSRLDLSSRKCFHPSAFPTSCNSFHARPLMQRSSRVSPTGTSRRTAHGICWLRCYWGRDRTIVV